MTGDTLIGRTATPPAAYPTLAAFWRDVDGTSRSTGTADTATRTLRVLFAGADDTTTTAGPATQTPHPVRGEPVLERLAVAVLAGAVLAAWTAGPAGPDTVRVHVCAGDCTAPVPVDIALGGATTVRGALVTAHRTLVERAARMRACPEAVRRPVVLVSCAQCPSTQVPSEQGPPAGDDTVVALRVGPSGRLDGRVRGGPAVAGADPAIASGFADVVAAAVAAALADPDATVAVVGTEAARTAGLRPAILYGDRTTCEVDLLGSWDHQVNQRPDAVAIVDGEQHHTYAQLESRAAGLAAALDGLDLPAGAPVAIAWDRCLDAVAAVLAAMRTGRAWVPVPPDLPRARRAEMVRATGAVAVLGPDASPDADLGLPRVSAGAEVSRRPRPTPTPDPDADLCVLFTSGSTGRPAGVRISHAAAANRLQWMWARHPWEDHGCGVWLKSLGLVGSLWEVFGGLLAGRPTVIAAMADLVDPARLWDLLDRHRVTRLLTAPPILHLLLTRARRPGVHVGQALSLVTSSAEPLSAELAGAWRYRFPEHRLLNLYGLTECASNVAVAEIAGTADMAGGDGSAPVSLGVPIDNCRLAVVDAAGAPMPRGVAGELVVGGVCVGKPLDGADTARFGHDGDGSGAPHVRTGDLARLGADGRIVLVGRRDNQVKLRGHRIALEEVEAAVLGAGGPSEAVCGLVGEGRDAALVCWYVGHPDVAQDTAEDVAADLAERCRAILPGPLVPARFLPVEAIPRLPSGKIDRAALRDRDRDRVRHGALADPEAGPVARAQLEVEELVGHPVTPGDRLAGLDMHSLRMVELHERLRTWASVEFDVVDLFRCATVEDVGRLTVGTDDEVAGRGAERARRYRAALARRRRRHERSR